MIDDPAKLTPTATPPTPERASEPLSCRYCGVPVFTTIAYVYHGCDSGMLKDRIDALEAELAAMKPWIYEDQLPSDLSRSDYDDWCAQSRIIDGVRMGPSLPLWKMTQEEGEGKK